MPKSSATKPCDNCIRQQKIDDKTRSPKPEAATKRLAHLEAKTDDPENRGRRKNVPLLGKREGEEGNQTLINLIHNKLLLWLELSPENMFTLEWAQSTVAPGTPNQARAIIIHFLNFQDKEFVYREARQCDIKYDGTKTTFAQDLS
ncbi:hypothetical protein CRENBAI_010340, partial [Crenichthys baileyi]